MIEAKHLPEYLERLAELNPHVIHTQLTHGDEFSTHPRPATMNYRVDDPDIHQEFGHEDDFGRFILEVGNRLKGQVPGQVLNLLFPPGTSVCDISEAVRLNVGVCLEKSTIVQLRAQTHSRVMLIKGLLSAQGFGRTFHAFNILDDSDAVHLVDAQNPIIAKSDSEKVEYPFCFPLKGYDENANRFVFKDPFEENIKWTYQLPLNLRTE